MKFSIIISVIVCLLLAEIAFVNSAWAYNGHQKRIYIVLRYDDCSARSSKALESKLIKALQERNMIATFGVIPFIRKNDGYDGDIHDGIPLPADKINLLKAAVDSHTIEIAQHGYSHDNMLAMQQRHIKDKIRSEFMGLSYGEQVKMIGEGKAALERWFGSKMVTFIPPYNTYDKNTVRALSAVGFKVLSGGTEYYFPTDSNTNLDQIPATAGISDVKDAVEVARKSNDSTPLIILLFHPEDFVEINEDTAGLALTDLNNTLDWLKAQKDIRVVSIARASEVMSDVGSARLDANRNALMESLVVPGFLLPDLGGVYFSTSEIKRIELRKYTLTALYFLAITLSSFIVSYKGLSVIRHLEAVNIVKYAGMVTFVVFMLYALRDFRIGAVAVFVLLAFIGAYIGVESALKRSNKSACQDTEKDAEDEPWNVDNKASI